MDLIVDHCVNCIVIKQTVLAAAFPHSCLWRIVEALTAGYLHTHALVLAPGVDYNGLQAQGSVQGHPSLEAPRLQLPLCYVLRLISASALQGATNQLQACN
ncbi:ATP-binding cassette sub-family F member 1 [Fusarium oxysporum f. sp. albedinis]|nr:ATP-binding cassette sub-family F member 1 [Fusarium oxysporum f. sp. albedinis]